MNIDIIWLIITYILFCITYSLYLIFNIYFPITEELKYIVKQRWGVEGLNKTKRFSLFYTFIAFILGIIFTPYLSYNMITYGKYNFIQSYKHILWLDIREEILSADSKKPENGE